MSEEVILDITTVEETVTIDTTAPDVVQINVLAVTGGATTWDEIEDKPTEFPPSPHTHGNISNGGAIGSTADLVAVTGSGGVLTTASRSGIDSRTEFPPAAHTQGWNTLTGTVDIVPFTTTNGGPTATGELAWLASTESLALRLANGENLDIGEENVYHVDNNTGSTIAKGTAVSYAGTIGGSGKIRVKPWNGSTDAPEAFMGFAMGAIPNGEAGYVTAFGVIRGVNTSAFSDGVILYANPSGTGLTATKPTTTHVIACLCVNASNNGTILVRPTVDKITGWDDVTGKPTEFTPAPHTHGNITNDGRIGTTADLVTVTGAGGVLTTASRSGIDSRTSFPNADVAAATDDSIAGTIVKRSADNVVVFNAVELSGFGGIIGVGNNVQISLQAANSTIETQFGNSPIQTLDPTSNIITRGSFVLNGGANTITLSGTPTANRTITVPDASGTLILNTDSRLTDAREWTASTVTQAEAEAGTATTRRAWTAERVRQAVVGWYGTLSAAFRNFVASPTSANLATLVSDETGSGSLVFGTSPTLNVPAIRQNNASFSPLIIGSNGTWAATVADDVDAVSGLQMGNVSNGTVADFRFLIKDNTNHYFAFSQPGTGNSLALFGLNRSSTDYIFNIGGTPRDMAIGTADARFLAFATNGAIRARIAASGGVSIGTTTDAGANNLLVAGTVTASNYNPASGVANFLATPTSANLALAVTDETGSGSLVFGTSPTLTNPTINAINTVGSITVSGTGTSGLFGLRSTSTTGYSSLELLNSGGTQVGGLGYANSSAASYADQVYYYSAGKLLILATAAGQRHFVLSTTGDVSIGSGVAANTRAVLDLVSTTKGFLPPRMTTAQRDAISTPPAGLMVYNTSTNKLNVYNGTAWETVTSI